MATLPAADVLGDTSSGHTAAEFGVEIEQLRDVVAESPGGVAPTTLTIASGAITPPLGDGGGWHLVDTEGAAAADDLTTFTLTNMQEGREVTIAAVSAARVVTVKTSANIDTADGDDFVLDATDKWLKVKRSGSDVVEVARSYGADAAGWRGFFGVPKQISHQTLCPHRNLVGTYATAATVTYTADELILEDADGNQILIEAYNKTATITTAGAGGLDTGSEASSTWYHVWAIAQADGTSSILLSTASTLAGLTLPGSYTFAGYLGAVRNNGASNFVDYRQLGAVVGVEAQTLQSVGTATSATSLNTTLATLVPSTARKLHGHGRVSDSGSGVATLTLTAVTGTAIGRVVIQAQGGNTSAAGGYFEIIMPTAQTIYYSVGASESADIFATGWEF